MTGEFMTRPLSKDLRIAHGFIDKIIEKERLFLIESGGFTFKFLKTKGNLHKLFKVGYAVAFTYDESLIIKTVIPGYGGIASLKINGKIIHVINSRINWENNSRIGFPVKLKATNYEPTLTFADKHEGFKRGDNILLLSTDINYSNGAWNLAIDEIYHIHPEKVAENKKEEEHIVDNNVIPFTKAV